MKKIISILTLLTIAFGGFSQNIIVENKTSNHPDGQDYILLSPMGKVVKNLKGISIFPPISEGYIAAAEGGIRGYIDVTTGEWVIKLTDKGIKTNANFHNGWAIISFEDGHSMVIDKKGKIILDKLKGEVGNFENGVAVSVFSNENGATQYGIYDKTGKLIAPFTEDFIEPFKEGLALKTDSKTLLNGYVDATGQWAIKPQWKSAFSFSNGLAAVSLASDEDPLYGLIDTKGKIVIDYKFKDIDPFNEGYSRVGMENKGKPDEGYLWNFIDKKGKLLFEKPLIEKPELFSEGKLMIWDSQGEHVGFVDKANKTVIPQKLDFLNSCDIYYRIFTGFKEGLFPTQKGYIDTTGKIVISVPNKGAMCSAYPCENGLVYFSVYNNTKDNKFRNYVADKTGKILWQSVDNEVYACFPADIYVSMADGGRKKISDIQVGDKVFDLNNTPLSPYAPSRLSVTVVEAVEVHSGNFIIGAVYFNMPENVYFVSNNVLKNEVILEATLNHPLSIGGKKVVFNDVKMGDIALQMIDNQIVNTSISFLDKNYKTVSKVYNLKTKGKGYFVNGYGVFNK